LYYAKTAAAPTSLWRGPAGGGEETQVLDSLNSAGQFAVVERGIYFVAPPEANGTYYLSFLDFASGDTRRIAALAGRPRWGLSVSPDGGHILYTQQYEIGADLMLVENFR
jgi:hypothetical protein